MGHAKLKVPRSPSSCSPERIRSAGQEGAAIKCMEGWRTPSVCTGGTARTPAVLPLQGCHPGAGKEKGGGPKESWQQGLASIWVSDLEDLHWAGDCQVPTTAKSGSRTRAAPAHQEGQAMAARDETGTRSPTSALQRGLGFPACARQLSGQAHKHPYIT